MYLNALQGVFFFSFLVILSLGIQSSICLLTHSSHVEVEKKNQATYAGWLWWVLDSNSWELLASLFSTSAGPLCA